MDFRQPIREVMINRGRAKITRVQQDEEKASASWTNQPILIALEE